MKIKLEHLTKKFPSRNKKSDDFVIAANDMNFEIPDGKLVSLLGPSGCGKSTALNLICGLETPTEGKIFFDDEDVTELPPEKRGVGMVFQSYALYPHLNVRKNIMFPLQNLKGDKKMTKEEMLKKAEEAARIVQIEELMDRKPKEMSGGQQQRVAIARALVKTPRVLLLDEPLSNLDARLRIQTREEISRIQKETGVTTIFVTHDQEEAMSISDFIIVMKSGVVHQIGAPQDVYDSPANLFVAKFLGTPPINVLKGKVDNKKLYIGQDMVMELSSVDKEGDVIIGIRPEGFILDENGKLTNKLEAVEVMGRDTSIVSKNDASVDGAKIRSIISSEDSKKAAGDNVRFNLKPNKVFLFDVETEERINFTVKEN